MVKICTIRHSIISDGKCMQISCCDEDWWTDTKTIRRDLSALVRFNRVDRWQEYLALLVVRRVSVTTRVNEMNQSGKRRSKQSRRHSSASTTSDNGRVSLLEGGGYDRWLHRAWLACWLPRKENQRRLCVCLSLALSVFDVDNRWKLSATLIVRRAACTVKPALRKPWKSPGWRSAWSKPAARRRPKTANPFRCASQTSTHFLFVSLYNWTRRSEVDSLSRLCEKWTEFFCSYFLCELMRQAKIRFPI